MVEQEEGARLGFGQAAVSAQAVRGEGASPLTGKQPLWWQPAVTEVRRVLSGTTAQ